MDEIQHTPQWKEIYPKRKEDIKRVFGDCNEKSTLRYTRVKGLKNQHNALMIFPCHNLKKIARWRGKIFSNHTKDKKSNTYDQNKNDTR